MKDIINKIIQLLPLIYLSYIAYDEFLVYQEGDVELQKVVDQVKDINSKIKQTKERNRKALEFEQNLEVSRNKVKEVAAQIENVQKQLPNSTSDSEILETFSNEANMINMKNTTITPLKEEGRDFYFAKQYDVASEGTYLQFLVFFERIGMQDRLFNISSLMLSNSEGKHKGRFQHLKMKAVMEAFRYNPAASNSIADTEIKGATLGGNGGGAPGGTHPPLHPPEAKKAPFPGKKAPEKSKVTDDL